MASKTVYIVGAGASYEVGLPLGVQLKEDIARVLKYKIAGGQFVEIDDDIASAYSVLAQSENGNRNISPFLDAARRIGDAMPQAISIDNFIDANNDDRNIETCGKLAIAKCILKAERGSKLFLDPMKHQKLDFSNVQNTWLNKFFQLLTENCRPEQLEERVQSVAFVVFNYDRCIEHYLFLALQNYYGMSAARAAELVGLIDIYHPYGTVGPLPWQHAADGVAFGAEPTVQQLLKLGPALKTFTEGTEESSSSILALRSVLADASRHVYLGFAYHQQNLDLLFPKPKSRRQGFRIFGTAHRISKSDLAVISDELSGSSKKIQISLENLTCTELFDEFRRSLSLVNRVKLPPDVLDALAM